jgi:hypothetical protein
MRLWLALASGMQILILAPANAAPWVNFTDPKGQYSVMFPIAPTAKTATTWGPGKHFPVTAYAVMEGTARLLLMVTDTSFESVNADAKSVLDGQEANVLQGIRADTAKDITIDGVTGRYLKFGRNGERCISEIFFSRNHLYQLIANTSPTASAQDVQDAQRFGVSFHFVK